jgi:PKD repeat protein
MYIGDSLKLTASSFDVGVNDALDYLWDTGDGKTYSTPDATHDYDQAGSYTVSLTVTDQDGDTFEYSFNIKVVADPANAYVLPPPPKNALIKQVNSYKAKQASTVDSVSSSTPFSNLFNSNGAAASSPYESLLLRDQTLLQMNLMDLVPEEIDELFMELFKDSEGSEGATTAKPSNEAEAGATNIENEEVEGSGDTEEEDEDKDEKDKKDKKVKEVSFFKRTLSNVASFFVKA